MARGLSRQDYATLRAGVPGKFTGEALLHIGDLDDAALALRVVDIFDHADVQVCYAGLVELGLPSNDRRPAAVSRPRRRRRWSGHCRPQPLQTEVMVSAVRVVLE